jgi:hypothetical protein
MNKPLCRSQAISFRARRRTQSAPRLNEHDAVTAGGVLPNQLTLKAGAS